MVLFQRGQVIDRWQVLRRCGEGQFSEVYEVRDCTAGKDATRVSATIHSTAYSYAGLSRSRDLGIHAVWVEYMNACTPHTVGNEGGEAQRDMQHQAGAQGLAHAAFLCCWHSKLRHTKAPNGFRLQHSRRLHPALQPRHKKNAPQRELHILTEPFPSSSSSSDMP